MSTYWYSYLNKNKTKNNIILSHEIHAICFIKYHFILKDKYNILGRKRPKINAKKTTKTFVVQFSVGFCAVNSLRYQRHDALRADSLENNYYNDNDDLRLTFS